MRRSLKKKCVKEIKVPLIQNTVREASPPPKTRALKVGQCIAVFSGTKAAENVILGMGMRIPQFFARDEISETQPHSL